jgi:small-conductance mechanosensitive channel
MDSLRSELINIREILDWLPNPVVALLIVGFALLVALTLHRWLRRLIGRLFARRYPYFYTILAQTRGLTRLGMLLLALIIAVPAAPLAIDISRHLTHIVLIAIIAYVGWAAIVALNIAAQLYLRRFRIDVEDNLLARKHNTQVRVLVRTVDVVLVILTIAAALMTFPSVRQYGVSLFASAGVAGIVIGLGARPLLSHLFAGVQLAMTQPIRIADAVIVENEFGHIEEINSTYVVVRLWDLRRLIVPLSYFIEKPFQNWTRQNSALIGNVMIYVDYAAPINEIRREVERIAKESKKWDGDVLNVQVTDAKERTIQLRVIMSARSSGQAFDLGCEIREQLVDFLRREHPYALPRLRGDVAVEQKPAAKAERKRTRTAAAR